MKGIDNCFKDFKINCYQQRSKSILERFENNYIPVPESGCWLWLGAKDLDGYGFIRIDYTNIRAHRYSYEENVGVIPEGFIVCHRCDVPECVNPMHLFLGTTKDNVNDKFNKGRFNSGRHPTTGRFVSNLR